MTGGNVLGPDAIGILEQFSELQPGVAHDTRIWRSPGGVLGHEIIDDACEIPLEIQHIKRQSQRIGHPAGVGGVGRAAAALFSPRGRLCRAGEFRIQSVPHEYADHFMTRLLEQPCRHAAIDSSGHG